MSARHTVWTHTPAASEPGGPVNHCSECSRAASEWVQWPCSAERLVKAAVEQDRHLRAMDEGDHLAAAEAKVAAVRRLAVALRDQSGNGLMLRLLGPTYRAIADQIDAALTTDRSADE